VPARPALNLIGPGRLGRTLTRLLREAQCIRVGAVLGRSAERVTDAVGFIGAGRVAHWDTLPAAELTLLATPDDALSEVVAALAARGTLRRGDVVFHCSGALSSAAMQPLSALGAEIASIHPLRSFADPSLATSDFSGTYCGYEGSPTALAALLPLFERLGAHCFAIDASRKILYHAGAVLACNTLTALSEAALRSMEAAGVTRDIAWPALRPLIDGTLSNIDRLGARRALTGPVARGDATTVARQYAALEALDPQLGAIYRSLSALAVELAAPSLNPDQRTALCDTLGKRDER